MRQFIRALAALLLICSGFHSGIAQEVLEEQPETSIFSPLPGEAIRGSLPIQVDTATSGFVSAELSFGYENDETGTWFLIDQSLLPTDDSVMAEWDTTTITDGTYHLRLVVHLDDESAQTTIVPSLRVRNYSPVETPTPTSSPTAAPLATPSPTLTPSPVPTQIPPSPTPLPANPLQVTTQDIWANLLKGGIGGIAIIALAGLYVAFRRRLIH